jgi:hypothetical protein
LIFFEKTAKKRPKNTPKKRPKNGHFLTFVHHNFFRRNAYFFRSYCHFFRSYSYFFRRNTPFLTKTSEEKAISSESFFLIERKENIYIVVVVEKARTHACVRKKFFSASRYKPPKGPRRFLGAAQNLTLTSAAAALPLQQKNYHPYDTHIPQPAHHPRGRSLR